MKRTVLLVLLSLHCSSLTSCASGCHEDGPEDCTFYRSYQPYTFCSWSPGDHFVFYEDGPGHYYCAGLSRNAGEGRLTSRTACSTKRGEHCLQFKYRFEQNNVIDLSVSIRYETEEHESLLWITSSSTVWNNATVPVNTTKHFNIVFKAKRRLEHLWTSSDTLAIDDIVYKKSSCSSGLQPSNAQPTTTTTPTTSIDPIPTSRNISSASIDPATTVSSVVTGTTSEISRLIDVIKPTKFENTTAAVTTPSTSQHLKEKSSDDSNNVGITVGVILAVLIVFIIVIAVLLVLFRRKFLHVWNACCRNKQPKEQFRMNASQNGAYSLDTDEPSHPNGAVSNHTQQHSDNHCLDARASTHSSTYYCNGNTQPSNPSEPVYTKVNKPGKVPQESPPVNKSKPNSPVYEMCNEEAANCSNADGTEYQNLPPTMSKQEQDGQNNSSSPLPTLPRGYNLAQPQNSSSVYHILEKEPGTDRNSVHHVPNASVTAAALGQYAEYNSLDFNTKGLGETNSFDEEKAERAIGGVYSHLNEGDEDTYNEVHREKRDEVIDGVYSHIK